jgi:hypothetical protein
MQHLMVPSLHLHLVLFPVAKFVSVVQDDPSYNSVAVKDPGGPNPPNPKADV